MNRYEVYGVCFRTAEDCKQGNALWHNKEYVTVCVRANSQHEAGKIAEGLFFSFDIIKVYDVCDFVIEVA